MRYEGAVYRKTFIIKKLAFLLVLSVFSISCCPKDGVDRSSHVDSYNISLDIFDLSIQQPINRLDQESKLTLVLNDGSLRDSQSFRQTDTFHNRYIFYFDPNIKDEDVAFVEVKLIDYKDQKVDYKMIQKTPFQQEPRLLTLKKWNGFFCALNQIDWILPKAHALSCSAKDGSKITYRAGQLISLGLYPEIY